MARFPFLVVLKKALAANGSGSVEYTVPTGESMEIYGVMNTATGGFFLTDVRDTKGIHYSNASAAVGVPDTFLPTAQTNYVNTGDFREPINLEGGVTIIIDLLDTSGAVNTVTLLLISVKETG